MMIDHTTLITYLAILTGFVFIPGPAVLLTLARAASAGTRVGIATGLGIAVGDLVHTAMAVLGLSAILAASALSSTSSSIWVRAIWSFSASRRWSSGRIGWRSRARRRCPRGRRSARP